MTKGLPPVHRASLGFASRRVVRRALLAACGIVVIACAGSQRASSPAGVSPEAGAGPLTPTPRDQIKALADEIEAQRAQGSFAEPAPGAIEMLQPTPMARVPASTDATCKPAKTDRCASSCKLSDSICSNAGKICELAKELPGDTWAEGHCTRAKATCETAHQSCCGCQ